MKKILVPTQKYYGAKVPFGQMLKVGYRSVRLHWGVRSWFAYASCCQDVCCNLCAILEIKRAYILSAPDFMSICLYEITVNSNVVEFLCKKSGAPNYCFFCSCCCFEFSVSSERLQMSRWLFHSCTIFEAYLLNSLSIFWGLIFHISLSRLGYFP